MGVYKNLSPRGLAISGRQSELIELALTYAFGGLDVDMADMVKRSKRSSFEEAAKYLHAAEIEVGTFALPIDLDADDDTFNTQLESLGELAELAARLEATRSTLAVPAGTDRLPYHEYFDQIRTRIGRVAETVAPHNIRVGLAFDPGKEQAESKEFEFVRNVEGFLALVNAATEENVGLIVDTFAWQVGGGAMDQIDELDGKRVVAVRLADIADGVNPSEAKSVDRVLPAAADGSFDHVAVLKKLIADGFDGPVTPQAGPIQSRSQTRETTVSKAQERTDEIFQAAGLPVPPRPMDMIDENSESMMVGEE